VMVQILVTFSEYVMKNQSWIKRFLVVQVAPLATPPHTDLYPNEIFFFSYYTRAICRGSGYTCIYRDGSFWKLFLEAVLD
jgi:hypothetical protein